MKVPVSIKVNGRLIEREVEPRYLLVHFIRVVGELTGTKVGCDTSQCGACVVRIERRRPSSHAPALAVQADGAEVTTIEGLGEGEESCIAVQESLLETSHGLQCGFCTARHDHVGVTELLRDVTPHPVGGRKIRDGLEGNICRCTGYHNIVKRRAGRWRARRPTASMGG